MRAARATSDDRASGRPRLAFDVFFRETYERLRRNLFLATGDLSNAEEATEEALYQAYRRWPRVSAMDNPRAWTYRVALNASRRWQSRRREDASGLEVQGDQDSSDIAGQVASEGAMIALLSKLSNRQRTAVVLYYYCDLSIAEVAVAMDCAPGTVQATLHTARARLRELIVNNPTERPGMNREGR